MRSRGLCMNHYMAGLHLVRTRAYTWADLVAAGRAKPPKRHALAAWFLDALEPDSNAAQG